MNQRSLFDLPEMIDRPPSSNWLSSPSPKPHATSPIDPLPAKIQSKHWVSADVAYEAMSDALCDGSDPIYAEVKTDAGEYRRVAQCLIRSKYAESISVWDLLMLVRDDWQATQATEREELSEMKTSDWSM